MNALRFCAKSALHATTNIFLSQKQFLRPHHGNLIILTYHSFSRGWPAGSLLSLHIARFERQLEWLLKSFEIVSLAVGVNAIRAGYVSEKPRLVITIDDGFMDNFDLAYPVLCERGIPATVFVATDFIDSGRPPWPTQLAEILEGARRNVLTYPFSATLASPSARKEALKRLKLIFSVLPPEERYEELKVLRSSLGVAECQTQYPGMGWQELRKMAHTGIDIGAHTVHHSILPRISTEIVELEVTASKSRIEEQLQQPCTLFSYPDGKHDLSVQRIVAKAGFEIAVTQDNGANSKRSEVMALHRIDIPYNDPMPTFRRRVTSPSVYE